jgi:hypothetical protein
MKKSFLIPLAAAIATLTSAPAVSAKHNLDGRDLSQKVGGAISPSQESSEIMIQMVRGTELHDLILKSSASGQTFAYHSSHRSHSSHQSHSSHYSSR